MGGAQPLAATMNGGVMLAVEVDPKPHRDAARDALRRFHGNDLDAALKRVLKAKAEGEAAFGGPAGQRRRGDSGARREAEVEIDLLTDQTSAHDPLYGYIPKGMR